MTGVPSRQEQQLLVNLPDEPTSLTIDMPQPPANPQARPAPIASRIASAKDLNCSPRIVMIGSRLKSGVVAGSGSEEDHGDQPNVNDQHDQTRPQ